MIVQASNGIRFGTKSRAMIIAGGGKSASEAAEAQKKFARPVGNNDEVLNDVAQWGSANDLPEQMMKDIEATGVLSAAIENKARIAIGKGPVPALVVGNTDDGYEKLEFITDSEISDWLEMNSSFEQSYASVLDMFKCGQSWKQLLLSSDRKILAYKRLDPTQCRFSKKNERTGLSESTYISGDWSQYSNTTDKVHTAKIPLLNVDFPLMDLQSRAKAETVTQCMQYPLFGRQYYAPAPWWVARRWVKIVQAIPEMKEMMFKNQMTIKYIVEIHPEFWPSLDPGYSKMTPKEQEKFEGVWYDQCDKFLSGNDNAYKSVFTRKVYDKKTGEYVPGVTVTSVDDKIKDGKLIPDAGAANSEILFALAMNPALAGVSIPGTGSAVTSGSGSNIREAFIVEIMKTGVERSLDAKVFDMAKIVNGWQARLGRGKYQLVCRYPNQILTTLNTGANTQPTA